MNMYVYLCIYMWYMLLKCPVRIFTLIYKYTLMTNKCKFYVNGHILKILKPSNLKSH